MLDLRGLFNRLFICSLHVSPFESELHGDYLTGILHSAAQTITVSVYIEEFFQALTTNKQDQFSRHWSTYHLGVARIGFNNPNGQNVIFRITSAIPTPLAMESPIYQNGYPFR